MTCDVVRVAPGSCSVRAHPSDSLQSHPDEDTWKLFSEPRDSDHVAWIDQEVATRATSFLVVRPPTALGRALQLLISLLGPPRPWRPQSSLQSLREQAESKSHAPANSSRRP